MSIPNPLAVTAALTTFRKSLAGSVWARNLFSKNKLAKWDDLPLDLQRALQRAVVKAVQKYEDSL